MANHYCNVILAHGGPTGCFDELSSPDFAANHGSVLRLSRAEIF